MVGNGERPDYWMVRRVPFLEDLQVVEAPWFFNVFTQVYANQYVILYKRVGLAPEGPLRITTLSLPGGSVGTSYSATISAVGGRPPYSWSVLSGNLPYGLQFGSNRATSMATVSGNPRRGTFAFTVRATGYAGARAASGNSATTLLIIAIS